MLFTVRKIAALSGCAALGTLLVLLAPPGVSQEPGAAPDDAAHIWVSVTLSTPANMGDGEEYLGRMRRAQFEDLVVRGKTTGFLTLEQIFWIDEDDEIVFPEELHPGHTDTAHIHLKDVSVLIPLRREVVEKAHKLRGRI